MARRPSPMFQGMDVVATSIPLFFALIGIELGVSRIRGRASYRLSDSISDLSLGILSQLTGLGITLMTYALFAWVSANWSLQRFLSLPEWPSGSPWSSAAAFEQRDTWWRRLVRTRLRADCRGVPSSTCSARMLCEATSTRSTRYGELSSLVSCPNCVTSPSYPNGARRATWLSAIGCSML